MDTTIRLKVSELNASLIDRIKNLLKSDEDEVITITVGKDAEYLSALLHSKNDLENGRDLISLTMEELISYTDKEKQ